MKIGIVGVFGTGADFTTGQAVKCLEVSQWLQEHCGEDTVRLVNTYQWKKNPLKLFWGSIRAFQTCDHVLMLPAQHGLKVFAPLMYYLKKLYGKQVHYIVIGGWLPQLLKENARMRKYVCSYDGTYVETESMAQRLKGIGVSQAVYMPNCRKLPDELPERPEWTGDRLPVCTYSRVTQEKGILDAMEIVRKANEMIGKPVFSLDIYGKVAPEFQAELDAALAENGDIAAYRGVKQADEGVQTLSQYYALLFPTYYKGEGFAGTVLDAFAARTPVIANDWKYNAEVVSSGVDGFIYPCRDLDRAAGLLVQLYREPALYQKIQAGCRDSARRYSTDAVMTAFLEHLN